MIKGKYLFLLLIGVVSLLTTACSEKPSEALTIVSRYKIRYEAPPQKIPSPCATDAPLLGNGFMSVAISGEPEKQAFYVCRNDFWRLKSAIDESYPAMLGKIELSLPAMEGATYLVEQQLDDATTVATFRKGNQTVQYTAYASATSDLFVVELSLQGEGTVQGTVSLEQRGEEELYKKHRMDSNFPSEMTTDKTSDGILSLSRSFTQQVDIPTHAAMALRMMDGNDTSFELKPGTPVRFVCSTSSNFKGDDCLKRTIGQVASLTPQLLEKERQGHLLWWKNYWEQSYVSIPDTVIEKHYYISLYGMGACSRDADFPPSIFGAWITQEVPFWNGDYHLNYNHMAPYYALFGANRIEQADPYTNSMLAQIERGKYYSEKICGIKDGILLPVGAGPLGIETTRRSAFMDQHLSEWITSGNVEDEGVFWGQKSNTAYAVTNMSMQFYRTWDRSYSEKTYPFVKAVATFWENYLTREGDRYAIYNDAIHEGTVGTMNPILSLGLVRMVMHTASDMSEFLGVDADKRVHWKEIQTHLSAYPQQERNGRTVFRYTERGCDWWDGNTLGIQHIYPAGQIGLDSDPELLRIAHNTIDEMQRWKDFNGTNSFFPAAVRVGYNADTVLTKLHEYALHTYPNGFQKGNPHGIENFSTTPNTINEMLCMGHQDVVRLFPVWPYECNARFEKIRVEGAFLVSGELKNGEVQPVRLLSEQGRPLILLNPWKEHKVKITSSDGHTDYAEGERITLATKANISYTFTKED